MIPLRQHVASLVAVFLALAVGIALGGGPLASGDDDGDNRSSGRSSGRASPTAQPSATTAPRTDYGDAFASAGAARLYADGLAGHATAILTLPDADTVQVKALQTQVIAAGGAITGTFAVATGMVDPANESAVDTTSVALMNQLGDPRIEPTAPVYERMGELLGVAVATTQPSSVRADLAAVSVRDALSTAGLLTSPQDVRCAPLVLVVLPPGADGPKSSLATRTILSGLVSGVAHNAAGVVVVGDEASAESGDLSSLRASELTGPVSTVDGIETALGQVTAVLAMEAVIAGTTGSYGASGSDGAVPLG